MTKQSQQRQKKYKGKHVTGCLFRVRAVPLAEAFGEVAAALAMGDSCRRTIPVRGRRYDEGLAED